MRFLILFLLVAIFSSPAFAVTQEQAKRTALDQFPGKAIASNHYVAGDVSIYEVVVEQDNHALVEVEINAFNGTLLRTMITKFPEGSAPPAAKITEDQAFAAAQEYADEHVRGTGAAERGKEIRLVMLNNRLAYEARVRKAGSHSATDYDVYVDARSGQGFSLREN